MNVKGGVEMKKYFAILVCWTFVLGFSFQTSEAADFSTVQFANQQQNKYTPPPARNAPPQAPNYGRTPAYTPPPPPEPKK